MVKISTGSNQSLRGEDAMAGLWTGCVLSQEGVRNKYEAGKMAAVSG